MNMNRKTNSLETTFAAALTFVALITPGLASAEDAMSAEAISAAVSDHSYQGSMSSPNSGFNEYYAADGTIYGKDYEGKWTTKKGEMCFAYGEAPTCYEVSIDGPSMVLRQDGSIKGNGMLIQGNTVR